MGGVRDLKIYEPAFVTIWRLQEVIHLRRIGRNRYREFFITGCKLHSDHRAEDDVYVMIVTFARAPAQDERSMGLAVRPQLERVLQAQR